MQVALLCQREVKKYAVRSQRASKELNSVQPRARRLMKEALIYWRKYEKVEREQRKKAEKEAMEQRKRDDEMREVGSLQRIIVFNFISRVFLSLPSGKETATQAEFPNNTDGIVRSFYREETDWRG